jgi:2-methylcitrate dehydratase PrpD
VIGRAAAGTTGFIRELSWDDVPAEVAGRVSLLLADLAAVCVAGRPAPASLMAADHAAAVYPGDDAVALLDGRRTGAVGAAWANGVLANVLDMDDGHRLTKGHPGAVVIPAALAAAQLADAAPEELALAVLVGYEVAVRAGVALHGRDSSYHASGAWGSLGAAAAAARLLDLDEAQTGHALGLAEYHAPIAPIMRSVAEPQMTKDACAWGAALGVESALLAARGFTSLRPEYLDAAHGDLGSSWRVSELYVKAYPCCRWTQGAIRAALEATGGRPLTPDEVEGVTIRTFAAAGALARVVPTTTEEAQYSLVWPVATVLARGGFTVADVLGPWDEPELEALAEATEVVVDPVMTAAFPERRLTAVEVRLRGGKRLAAGPLEARGEPGGPDWEAVVRDKVTALVEPARDLAAELPPGGVRGWTERELLAFACRAVYA